MSIKTEKRPAPSQKAGPDHARGRRSAKEDAQTDDSLIGAAEQLNSNPIEVVEAALAAMLSAWPDVTEHERARILANLGARRETVSRVISLQRAAHLAGVSEQTAARWCERHGLGHRIGGRWAVDGGRLDAFLAGGAL